jgi:regulator of PEP synthase PpsR (kinase-PPPase family)
MPKKKTLNLFIVSDATGATAESVLTSVLVQFTKVRFNIERFPFTRTKDQVDEIIEKAPKGKCIIVFTLVTNTLRTRLIEKGNAKALTMVDVMGPLISIFSSILQHSPKMKPGVLRHQDEEMARLVEAIHYTLLHDDGLGQETVHEADLIILGVSRTGKTPTSIYLSCRKLKVANIPIIKDVPFPKNVAALPVKKVGFRMGVDRLTQLRAERVSRMACAQVPGYSSKSHILEEEEYCEQVYSKIPNIWTIDVTNRPIEETSDWITRNVL